MEFLATLTTVGTLITEGVKLGRMAFREKTKKLKELETAFTDLKRQVNDEGERITSYRDFMKLIADVDRTLVAIRKSHEDIDDTKQFLDHIRDFHENLIEFGIAQLRNFGTDALSDVDKVRIEDHGPRLSDHIVKAGAEYDKRNRKQYLTHIRDTVAEIGYLRAIGATILEDIGSNLRRFG